MKSFKQLTESAITARKNNVSRAEFLASLDPQERSNGALQFDRAERLDAEKSTPATADEIAAEARRIAVGSRLAQHCSEHSSYGPELLSRILSGRIMSDGMQREADAACEYANLVTDEEIADARPQAIENLNVERNFLAARLGITK